MGERALYDRLKGDEWHTLKERIGTYMDGFATSEALRSEVSAKFLNGMIGAMMVSFHKYGALANAYPEKVNAIGKRAWIEPDIFDELGSFGKRLKLYYFGKPNLDFGLPGEPEYSIEPGNVEMLIDAANFLMIEFMHPAHPKAHYLATDASGSPGRVALNEVYDGKANQFSNTDLVDGSEVITL